MDNFTTFLLIFLGIFVLIVVFSTVLTVMQANMRNQLIQAKMASGEIGDQDTIVGGQYGRGNWSVGFLFGAIGALIANISAMNSGKNFVMAISPSKRTATVWTVVRNQSRRRTVHICPKNLESIDVRRNFGGILQVRLKLSGDSVYQDMQIIPVARGEDMVQVMEMLLGLKAGGGVVQMNPDIADGQITYGEHHDVVEEKEPPMWHGGEFGDVETPSEVSDKERFDEFRGFDMPKKN